jgi:hypothetical protein
MFLVLRVFPDGSIYRTPMESRLPPVSRAPQPRAKDYERSVKAETIVGDPISACFPKLEVRKDGTIVLHDVPTVNSTSDTE